MATTLLCNDGQNNLKIQTSLPPDFRAISFTKRERNMKATLDLSGYKTLRRRRKNFRKHRQLSQLISWVISLARLFLLGDDDASTIRGKSNPGTGSELGVLCYHVSTW